MATIPETLPGTARWATTGAALVLLTGLVACAGPTADQPDGPARPVEQVIADAALAACVATAAGLPDATGTASDADLDAIEELHCDGQTSARAPIRSLEGIQHLSGLDVLDARLALFDLGLSENTISDLTLLTGTTTLNALGVAAAQVTDIGPLAGQDAPRVLDLSGNAITDVSPLAGLADPDTLRLAQNGVVDPTPLGTIPTLLVLDVFGDRIGDVSGLA